MSQSYSFAPLYLEDLAEGRVYETGSRTVTEADVVNFAGVSGDFNQIHLDSEFAKETPYGQRVVYGLLVLSLATGLLDRSGLFNGTAVAMLGINDWSFRGPVFIGDTVRLRLTILSFRRSSRRPDTGVVQRSLEILNQRGEVVQSGRIDLLLRARNPA
jgi:acyl dehydratase